MRPLILVPLFLALMGCDQLKGSWNELTGQGPKEYAAPCLVEEVVKNEDGKTVRVQLTPEHGYRYIEESGTTQVRFKTHCIPCKQAKEADQKFACEGRK